MHRQNLSKLSADSFPEDASPHGVRGEAKGNEGREKTKSGDVLHYQGEQIFALYGREKRREHLVCLALSSLCFLPVKVDPRRSSLPPHI